MSYLPVASFSETSLKNSCGEFSKGLPHGLNFYGENQEYCCLNR